MIKIGIYQIKSVINPKRIYIGSAVNIRARWRYHLFDLRRNNHHSIKLQRHYNKYGESDLIFSILLICDKENLIKTEQFFIDSYSPYFNSCKIAGNCMGRKLSEETKKKISEKNKKRRGQVPWNKGLKQKEETKLKISKKMSGRKRGKLSPEWKKKISDGMMGNIPWNKKVA